MQIIEIQAYSFEELKEEIQEKVINNFKYEEEFQWLYDEVTDSFISLVNTCTGIKEIQYYDNTIEFYEEKAQYLSGKRAFAWIENNLLSHLRIGYNLKSEKNKRLRSLGKNYRPENIKPCPFTGICYDENLLETLLKEIKNGYNLIEAFYFTKQEVKTIIEREQEYLLSDERIINEIKDQDMLFHENGKIINF